MRNPEGTNFLVYQTSHQILDHMVPYLNLCCHFCYCQASILSDKIEFSFVSLNRGSSRLTTMVPTSSVCVPVFKKIYPSSESASTNASISTCMLMSYTNIWCDNFLLNQNYITAHYQDIPSPAIFPHCIMNIRREFVTWFSSRCEETDGTKYRYHTLQ